MERKTEDQVGIDLANAPEKVRLTLRAVVELAKGDEISSRLIVLWAASWNLDTADWLCRNGYLSAEELLEVGVANIAILMARR